jgi:hypothetical protein
MVILLGVLFLVALVYEASQGAEAPWTIAGVASNAGFTGADLVLAVAIAYGESSGNPSAENTTPPDNSYGLWQINVNAHPEYDPTALLDPQTNANAAFAIYSAAGNSFKPWGAFTNGSYQQYTDQAQSDVGNLSASGFDDSGDDSGDDEES